MAEIYIYDDIGPDYWGLVSARYVINELAKLDTEEPITVRINSPGGDVNEGIGIYNALARHKGEVTIEVDALAASAASYVAMAGDKRRIAQNAMLMIHDPYTIAIGNAEQLRQTAEVLDKYTSTIADAYAARSGQDAAIVKQWMADETWFTADEALASGMADELSQSLKVAAKFRPGMFKRAPAALGEPDRPVYDRQHVERLERQLQLLRKRVPA